MRSLVFLAPASLAHFPGRRDLRTTLRLDSRERQTQQQQQQQVTQVPDSVDPQVLPYEHEEEEEESSVATSIVEGAREQVPWEQLHPAEAQARVVADETSIQLDQPRDAKRVRIGSPVLVIETPQRNAALQAIATKQVRDPSLVSQSRSTDELDELDKSHVVVGDDTLAEEDSVETEQSARAATAGFDGPFLAASVAISTPDEEAEQLSLPIRAPVPAAVPAPTCRFMFLNKRPRHPSTTAPSVPSITLARCASPASVSTCASASLFVSKDVNVQVSTRSARDVSNSLHATLPTMNATGASLGPLSLSSSCCCSDASIAGGHDSIVPPPTLHFSLSSITPISSILANPSRFVGNSHSTTTAAAAATGMPGAMTSRVNLLVVVKDVGEISRVRTKAAGWTERVELMVMDGRMSTTRRLVDSESGASECILVDEAVEKHLFKVVLWGSLASQWTTTTPPIGAPLEPVSPQSPTSTTPTELQPGDVIHLASLSLSLSLSRSAKRLGPGFPRPPAPLESLPLVAHATANPHPHHHHNSHIQLCYRTNPLTRLDRLRNLDPQLAHFDLKSRRVYELSRLYHT